MKDILFLNLTTFSKTGGIERFNRCFLKALSDLDERGITNSRAYSAYDQDSATEYYDEKKYKGFRGRKAVFVIKSILAAGSFDTIVLGHINMAIIGLGIKKLYPSKKIILITHGIDVWRQLSASKKRILDLADTILSVSNFTKSKLIELHGVDADKIKIFPNTIDPFFTMPPTVSKTDNFNQRYGISADDFVVYTLTRLSATELFKGYDKVIEAIGLLVKEHHSIKYIIAGKYDETEKKRLDDLIARYNLQGHVILTGFIDEGELVSHYSMADVYIMPSKKEGFGIVFIEALVCGVPVIAGNADGSVDALLNGELGSLVNPDSVGEIRDALVVHIKQRYRLNEQQRWDAREKTIENFSFEKYRQRLENLVAAC